MTTIDDEIELVQTLRPYVTDITKSFGAYVGWYNGKPIFKVESNLNIHILCWDTVKNFHKDTKSVKVAIAQIIKSVNVIKQSLVKEKIDKMNQDFE